MVGGSVLMKCEVFVENVKVKLAGVSRLSKNIKKYILQLNIQLSSLHLYRETYARFVLLPISRRDDVPSWADVGSGPLQHDHHGLHDDLLQDHPGRGVLALGQSELQRLGELHQQVSA